MPFTHLSLILLIIFIWGFNFVVIKTGLQEIPPILLCCLRFFLTSIPGVFFIKRPNVPLKLVATYGLVMFAVQFFFLFTGLHLGAPAGLSSILLQSQVFFSLFLGVICFGEHLSIWRIIGCVVSFSGIGMIGLKTNDSITISGFIFVLAAAATWAIGNVISKKLTKAQSFPLVIWGGLFAWPPLLLASLLTEDSSAILASLHHLSWISLGSIAYLSYISTLIAYVAWNWLLQKHALSILTPFTLLIPIVGVFCAIAVLKEPFHLWECFAALLVMVGLCITRYGPKFFDKKDHLK